MSDLLQFSIVTLAAGSALLVVLRPYLRPTPGHRAPGCSNCASSRVRRLAAPPDVQPLRLIRR